MSIKFFFHYKWQEEFKITHLLSITKIWQYKVDNFILPRILYACTLKTRFSCSIFLV